MFLIAGGGPHAPFFSLLAQRKEGKRKAPLRLALRYATDSLRSSAKTGAAELFRGRMPRNTHERGGMRVAQGSPGYAGTSLLEQVLLVTFGDKQLAAQNSRRLARRASVSE